MNGLGGNKAHIGGSNTLSSLPTTLSAEATLPLLIERESKGVDPAKISEKHTVQGEVASNIGRPTRGELTQTSVAEGIVEH